MREEREAENRDENERTIGRKLKREREGERENQPTREIESLSLSARKKEGRKKKEWGEFGK